jgi:hypothetical protein
VQPIVESMSPSRMAKLLRSRDGEMTQYLLVIRVQKAACSLNFTTIPDDSTRADEHPAGRARTWAG